jgi:DNA modification methylase
MLGWDEYVSDEEEQVPVKEKKKEHIRYGNVFPIDDGLRVPRPKKFTTKVIEHFGFKPYSVWIIDKTPTLVSAIADQGEVRERGQRGGNLVDDYPFSEFSPDVASRCVYYWSEEGDLVLDPFMNRGSVVMMAKMCRRHGIAFEISPKSFEDTKGRVIQMDNTGLTDDLKPYNIELNLQDARKMYIPDESIDYILTSPPYWNVEKYESVKGQMSDAGSYNEFLRMYDRAIKECARVLKPDKYCTFVVGNFRKKKKFIDLACATKRIMRKYRLEMWDEVINYLKSPFIKGIGNYVKLQRTAKNHEFILTFKKSVR